LATNVGKQWAGTIGEQLGGLAHDVGCAIAADDKAALFLTGAKQQLSGLPIEFALQASVVSGFVAGSIGEYLAAGEQRQQGKY
jgi:hypothetical protein